MTKENVNDKHVYYIVGIIGLLLSATLVNLIVNRSLPDDRLVIPFDRLVQVESDKFERKSIESNISETIQEEPEWHTQVQQKQRKEHVVLAETIEKENSKFSISIIDDLSDDEIPDERDHILETFERRSLIQKFVCKHIRTALKAQKQYDSYEKLLQLHEKFYSLDYDSLNKMLYNVGSNNRRCLPPKRQFNSIFLLKKPPTKLLVCLPPKCGTTNYQRAFAAVEKGNWLDGSPVQPEELNPPKLYSVLNRVPPNLFTQWPLKLNPKMKKMVNVRNPFSRLHSGYNDKFRTDGRHQTFIRDYAKSIQPFKDRFDEEVDSGHAYSFNAFASYVISNPSDGNNDWHWKTQFWHCSPCQFNYKFITHLENSTEEGNWLLKDFKLENRTHIPGQYKTLPGHTHPRLPSEHYYKYTPKDLIKLIYRHYYIDFLIYGYSPEDVKKYVDVGTDVPFDPTKEDILKSRLAAKSIPKLRKPGVQYAVCN